jgi:hypothetical protein
VLVFALPAAYAHAEGPGGGALSTQTPYVPGRAARRAERPPRGFAPVFTQMVARHGARTVTSNKDLEFTKQLVAFARADNGLTELGAALGPEVERLQAAIEAIGYGQLSRLGQEEHQDLAARLLVRLRDHFERAARERRRVRIITSGKDRAVDSGANFAASLASHDPELAPLIDPPVTDPDLLFFHKQPQNKDYQDWLANDPTLASTLEAIGYGDTSRAYARRLLSRLVGVGVLDKLIAKAYPFRDPKTGALVALDEVDAATSVYRLYQTAPGLVEEGDWHLAQFVDRDSARWFEYVVDATEFYEKGPSFAGSDITFKMAKVLVDDFFRAVEDVASRRRRIDAPAATLRFAHAEILIPFAALMELPESDVQASVLYTRRSNPWRGSSVAPYAVNVQWDVFANSRGDLLVKMLYDETETRFKRGCRSIHRGSHYYAFEELKRCYGYR